MKYYNGAQITGYPVDDGVLEKELAKSIDNPVSKKNIKKVRKLLKLD